MPEETGLATEEDARRLIGLLDGDDLELSMQVAWRIMDAGLWRSWMPKAFIRLHRHEVTRLMRHLGPMIPGANGRPRQRQERALVVARARRERQRFGSEGLRTLRER